MKNLEEIYQKSFFSNRKDWLSWRVPVVCGTLNNLFHPKVMIDVGCAIGDLVEGFLSLRVSAFGLEGSKESEEFLLIGRDRLIYADLRVPLVLPTSVPKEYDLVTCFEVAEHIEEIYSDILLDNLALISSKWLVMSHAVPGQIGHHHVNCQDSKYWIDKVRKRNFRFRDDLAGKIQEEWKPWSMKDGIRAYYEHLLVFEKEGKQ